METKPTASNRHNVNYFKPWRPIEAGITEVAGRARGAGDLARVPGQRTRA